MYHTSYKNKEGKNKQEKKVEENEETNNARVLNKVNRLK
jgi:hypothetical protein